MKKHVVLILLFLTVCVLLGGSEDEVVLQVNGRIDSGRYSEALAVLSKAIRTYAAEPERQALYIKTLGDFYADVCGDMQKAAMNYNRVLNGQLPGEHRLKQEAGEKIRAIKKLQQEYVKEDARLKALLARAGMKRDLDSVSGDIAQLRELIETAPGYYLAHEVYYGLALNYEVQEKPGRVYRLLKQAMAIKPGIVFYLPAKWKAGQAREAHIRNITNDATRIVLWLLLVITIIVFYRARPWQWVRLRHIVLLILLLLSWHLVFSISHHLVGAAFDSSPQGGIQKIPGKDIEYMGASPGSPGSGVVDHLYYYGIIGIAAIFIFTIGMKGFKAGKTVIILTCLYGFLIFSAFSTLFYMKYCDRVSEFKPGAGIGHYLDGHIYFMPEEPEAYILTNPGAYPGLEIEKVTDSYLKDWITNHCPEVKKKN